MHRPPSSARYLCVRSKKTSGPIWSSNLVSPVYRRPVAVGESPSPSSPPSPDVGYTPTTPRFTSTSCKSECPSVVYTAIQLKIFFLKIDAMLRELVKKKQIQTKLDNIHPTARRTIGLKLLSARWLGWSCNCIHCKKRVFRNTKSSGNPAATRLVHPNTQFGCFTSWLPSLDRCYAVQ